MKQPTAPSSTASLLAEIEAFVCRFIVFRDSHQGAAVALWVAHTHAVEAAESTPYLAVLSAEKRSGKSRLLELFARLCARAEHVSGISEAALFQVVEASRPTLLIDEIDSVFGVAAERTEALRGAINSGNRRAGTILRGGKDGQPVRYSTYCPKVLAGIETGRLPDTIRDRSIPILLRRKPPGVEVERLLWRDVGEDVDSVHGRLAEWGKAHEQDLARLRPDLPSQLDDRAAEAWEPLLAIADHAGSEWSSRAREAALALAGDFGSDDESRGVRLLIDLRAIFDAEALSSADLIQRLNSIEDAPWGSWHDGSGIKARDLARLLKPYEVRPRTVRIGDATPKGYGRDDLLDPWSRYIPGESATSATSATNAPRYDGDVADVADVADLHTYRQATADEDALAERLQKLGDW